ncbi:hypothetical protein CASFOL_005970 [Castilleja foliolosa]|uniref:Receptor-like serine/threonine-protein kinase n=1 Tax=Castilleja foliolosa TaxID=1961234 RepID=A0ABD3E709_9LAMI
MPMPLTLKSLLIFLSYFLLYANSTVSSKKTQNFTDPTLRPLNGSKKLQSTGENQVLLKGNTTITSPYNTFKVGFFTPNDEFSYFGIWYASIPIPTYVWVANREKPIKNLPSVSAEINQDGKLALMDQESKTLLWESNNVEKASDLKLLEQGNLVLLSSEGTIVWQSFDSPTDTWLPGMKMKADQKLTSWRSSIDPSPGRYFLRLNPPDFGEIALSYNNNSVDMNAMYTYWTTGKWSGSAFDGVPEMTIPYIYKFDFINPFTPMATFGYTEVPLEIGMTPPLTRFILDHTGQLKQFTWAQQIGGWNMFWSQPENACRVYGLCGNLGLCNGGYPLSPCRCLDGFAPVDRISWDKGDFSEGCWREGGNMTCGHENDTFEEVGVVSHERMATVSFSGTRSECETACLKNCSCVGLYHNEKSNLCRNLYGSLLNLRNVSNDNTIQDKLYVRVQKMSSASTGKMKNKNMEIIFLIATICCILVILMSVGITYFYLRRRKARKSRFEDDNVIQVTNLRMFTYKELHTATKGFSVKLGHGGFGAVFQGTLNDSSVVAVKRLERPGGGEKEFRAEVCTIGNIQHVNLVRLRGFCSENSHRLLVYDFMPNGALSSYLKHNGPNLSWDVRLRAAISTARGIAYLHEECRNCIIHCDIKPENILLDEDFNAKVSDFGLAKLIGRDFSRVLATMRGTWGYVAPEWISGVAITTKADVYSYGMTLLELIGGRRNVEGGPPSARTDLLERENREKWYFPPWAARRIIEGDIRAVVDERLSGLYDEAEAARLGLVAVWCIQDDESMRPAMGMVVKMLEGVVEVVVPPPPKLLQALVSGESFRGVGDGSTARGEEIGGVDDNVSVSVGSRDSRSSV